MRGFVQYRQDCTVTRIPPIRMEGKMSESLFRQTSCPY
jgi:hypothetical protein